MIKKHTHIHSLIRDILKIPIRKKLEKMLVDKKYMGDETYRCNPFRPPEIYICCIFAKLNIDFSHFPFIEIIEKKEVVFQNKIKEKYFMLRFTGSKQNVCVGNTMVYYIIKDNMPTYINNDLNSVNNSHAFIKKYISSLLHSHNLTNAHLYMPDGYDDNINSIMKLDESIDITLRIKTMNDLMSRVINFPNLKFEMHKENEMIFEIKVNDLSYFRSITGLVSTNHIDINGQKIQINVSRM